MKTLLYVVVASLFISAWLPPEYCSNKPVGKARGEDIIPYIKCQVCKKLAEELYCQVQIKISDIAPNKISKDQIFDIAENACNHRTAEAGWILQTDIEKKGGKLELVEKKGSEGQCNSECETIEQACEEVKEYHTHVAKYLYRYKHDLDSLIEYFCKGQACSTKPPPVPKDRAIGEPFVPKSDKEAEMAWLLKSMEGMMPVAAGMKMCSWEDLMNNNFGGDGDDEAGFPSKLGLTEKIRKGFSNVVMTLKRLANKLWRGEKAGTSKKGQKTGKWEL